jgi:hypothetical protein
MRPIQRPVELLTARELGSLDVDPRAIRRSVEKGTRTRIKRGAYCDSAVWAGLSPAARHRMRIFAFAESHPRAVFSHWSAALMLRLPLIGPIPDEVHVAAGRAGGGRSEPGLTRHCRGLPPGDWMTVSGIRLTTVERTLTDLAAAQPFRHAMAPIDHALRTALTSAALLRGHIDAAGVFRDRDRAVRALEFGDGRAQLPGESMSRAIMHQQGFPPPLLQVEHAHPTGERDVTDFEWPEFRRIGEFDGEGKYLKTEYRGTRSASEVVVDEKNRENRLRRLTGSDFARWDWSEAFAVTPLCAILTAAGLPRRR